MSDPQDLKPTCLTCGGHGMIGGLLPSGGGYDSEDCPECSKPSCDLSRELRACNAQGNAIAAERKMAWAADAIDSLVNAVHTLAVNYPSPMKSGVRAVMDLALAKTELP